MGVNTRVYWERFQLGNREPLPLRASQRPMATGWVQGGYQNRAQPLTSNSSWINFVTVPAVWVNDGSSYSIVMKDLYSQAQEMQDLARELQDRFLDLPFEVRELGALALVDDITTKLTISSVAWSAFSAKEATFTTSASHGMSANDMVVLRKASSPYSYGEVAKVISVTTNTFTCAIREIDYAASPPVPKYQANDIAMPADMWWGDAVFREMRFPMPPDMAHVGYAYEGLEFDFECGEKVGFPS